MATPDIAPRTPSTDAIEKAATGVVGFDEITRGGLPCNRATLLIGGPGTGKTLFALQTLVNRARAYRAPGLFVAFEESSRQIVRDLILSEAGVTLADVYTAGGEVLVGTPRREREAQQRSEEDALLRLRGADPDTARP